jgi:hypothetical protein
MFVGYGYVTSAPAPVLLRYEPETMPIEQIFNLLIEHHITFEQLRKMTMAELKAAVELVNEGKLKK